MSAAEVERFRDRILKTAAALFQRHGYNSVSLKAIAGEVGLTAPALYHYFDSKDALMRQLLARSLSALQDSFAEAVATHGETEKAFARFLHAYIEFAFADPARFRFLFLHNPDEADARFAADPAYHEAYYVVRRVVAAIMRQSGRQPDESEIDLTIQVAWGTVHGAIALLMTKQGFPFVNAETLLEGAVRHALAAIIPAAAGDQGGESPLPAGVAGVSSNDRYGVSIR